ncbi:MAG: response regulator [Pleomorphochaeta sp.]
MENIKKNEIIVFGINKMFVFLLFVEIINLGYSFVIDSLILPKIVLNLIFIILIVIYNLIKKEDKFDVYHNILVVIYFIYLLFFIPKNDVLFSFGFYLLEFFIVLVSSHYKLKIKVIIQLLFVTYIIALETVFNSLKLDYSREIFFILSFYVFTLFALFVSDSLTSKLIFLLKNSEESKEEIEISNNFFKTILNQEKIKIFYFFPDTSKAVILSNNIDDGFTNDIPNFYDYVRVNNIIPLEYFGLVQNTINSILKEGSSSITLPISFFSEEPIWMKLNGTKIFDKELNQDKIIVSATNVNDIKNIELKFNDALKKCSISTWEYNITDDTIENYSDSILDYYFYGNKVENASKVFITRKIIYYEDINLFQECFEKVKLGENDVTIDLRVFPSRNSSYTWVRIHFSILKDKFGKPYSSWVSIENINDAKISEKWFEIERRKSFDNRLGLITMVEMNVSRDFVIDFNTRHGVNINKNKENKLSNLLDYFLSSGVIVKNGELLYTRLSQKSLIEHYEKGERVLEYKYKLITKENDLLYISNIIKLFFDMQTKEIIAFIFFYDVTENTISQLSLDAIFKSHFVYLAYVNLLNSHMSISKTQLKDVTNASNLNRIYKDEWSVFIEKYVHLEDKEYVYSQVDIENVRERMRYKDNFTFDYRINDGCNMVSLRRCHFIKAHENDPIILIVEENVTNEMINRVEHEVVLKEALLQATQAANAKSEFLSRMSHEIRTPLSAIIGLSELGISNDSVDYIEYFNKINDSSTYLLGLLNDILDMNKLELGQVKLTFDAIDIDEFYNMIITIAENQAKKKNINFIFKHEKPYYKYQIIERLRVQQIILNILNNALKYTHQNGKVIYLIKNVKENGKLFAIHTIEDSGVGISKDFIDKIYTPFSREKNSLSDTEGGTGLGLAICSNLVKQLNGEITLESELNKGTKVQIKLPIKVISEKDFVKNNKAKSRKTSKVTFENKKILIAEDHEINAMVIKTILEKLGISTIHAENGNEAVNIFKESSEKDIDLILMDIMMPEIDGLEATMKIRELDRKDAKTVPIIALSANAFDEDVDRSIKVGMNDHLRKPIQMNLLIDTLKKYL